MMDPAERFLSSEGRDPVDQPDEAFDRLSRAALQAARATNQLDEHVYRFGCSVVEPGWEHLLRRIRSGTLSPWP